MTSDTWFAIPSARPAKEAQSCLDKWRQQGYKIAVYRPLGSPIKADICVQREYTGWPSSVNDLARLILDAYPETQWIVAGGDDTWPDQKLRAEEIAQQCTDHFHGTYGVMQPTGDRWMEDKQGRCAVERIIGSPWMGAEAIRRMNEGDGVLHSGYFHFYSDEEGHEVTKKLGILWERRDLTHWHNHWLKNCTERPNHLLKAGRMWGYDQTLFQQRKAAGFPGHEPLSVRPKASPIFDDEDWREMERLES